MSAFDATFSRQLEPEIMDQPDLEPALHRAALTGLTRINRWSGSARILWEPIRRLVRSKLATGQSEPLKILDIATGAGDVPIALWRRAKSANIPLKIDACDRSPVAVEHARQQASSEGADVHFLVRDALNAPLPSEYDIITCSLFLHHLDVESAVKLLASMSNAAGQMVLVNDLRRCRAGYALAIAGCHFLSRSAVVHNDGPQSVRGAYTLEEVGDLARVAGLRDASIERRFPCRFLLMWNKQ